MKLSDLGDLVIEAGILLYAVVMVGYLGFVIYVAAHFIVKFW